MTMFSLAAWISIISFMLAPVVVIHGVGYAVRSIVTCIIMPQLEKSFLRQRIIMMRIAVRRRQDSSRKITVLGGIILTALSVGKGMKVTGNNKLLSLFHPLP